MKTENINSEWLILIVTPLLEEILNLMVFYTLKLKPFAPQVVLKLPVMIFGEMEFIKMIVPFVKLLFIQEQLRIKLGE